MKTTRPFTQFSWSFPHPTLVTHLVTTRWDDHIETTDTPPVPSKSSVRESGRESIDSQSWSGGTDWNRMDVSSILFLGEDMRKILWFKSELCLWDITNVHVKEEQ